MPCGGPQHGEDKGLTFLIRPHMVVGVKLLVLHRLIVDNSYYRCKLPHIIIKAKQGITIACVDVLTLFPQLELHW